MVYSVKLDENNRIKEYASPIELLPDGIIVCSMPDNYWDYKYIDSEWVYDPLPKLDYEKKIRITELKQNLAETDYIVIKVAEGVATWDDYPDIKEQRQAWREEINKLEAINQ